MTTRGRLRMKMTDLAFLESGGVRLAYRRREGKGPCVVWLGGFRSDMDGTKAAFLDGWAARRGRAYLRFDYSGHGSSGGDFLDGTISRWFADALAVFDALSEGPVIPVGSSMGGWIALLLARARPERIAGLVLVAPAPDFTEDLMWAGMPEEVRRAILENGRWQRPSAYGGEGYPITRALIEDGRKNLLLRSKHAFPFPVRILQGMQDADVPWRHALRLCDAIEGDVRVTLVKNGDHRLSTPSDLKLLENTLDALIEDIA
jgi:pimeloyl-ACP methyl ester carboxylesterase